jgi:hypothetical protein
MRKFLTGAVLAATATAGLPATAMAAEDSNQAFNFLNSSYILTMRSGAVEPYARIPRDLPTDVGYSYVDLVHDIGQKEGRCEAWGAGYWLGQEVEEGVLGLGAAPPDAGDVSYGYKNPTTARNVKPNLSPPGVPNQSDRTPVVPAKGGLGPNWQAQCDHDAKGNGTGETLNVAGAKLAGSTTNAEVNKSTGEYTGTSRSYIQDVEVGGHLASITSLMQVRQSPDKKPTITYRISFLDQGTDDKNNVGLSQKGFTLAGKDIPADQYVKQFNDQVKSGAKAFETLGPLGLTLLAPTVGQSTDGGRFAITAPVIAGNAGAHLRDGTIGQEQGVRFASVTFEGVYGNA